MWFGKVAVELWAEPQFICGKRMQKETAGKTAERSQICSPMCSKSVLSTSSKQRLQSVTSLAFALKLSTRRHRIPREKRDPRSRPPTGLVRLKLAPHHSPSVQCACPRLLCNLLKNPSRSMGKGVPFGAGPIGWKRCDPHHGGPILAELGFCLILHMFFTMHAICLEPE